MLVHTKTKKHLEDYRELWNEIKHQIETISDSKAIEYKRGFMKIKFESNDDLSLAKILRTFVCIITARSVFQDDNIIIHKFIYMNVCMGMKMILTLLYK